MISRLTDVANPLIGGIGKTHDAVRSTVLNHPNDELTAEPVEQADLVEKYAASTAGRWKASVATGVNQPSNQTG
ncbi:hypothetical protein BRPE64_ECDS00060 (plasmid) [Caballeronia insecticola]|uniref:Uncharacterized protein n=1 Tax=Caballeronia insecticola TaxID=758793 RepID=R4WUD1_9BURK|nr:hypothetical protein BRPE64_ECDS00060 [Caballeronia insecticola]